MRVCRQGWPFVIGCTIAGAILLVLGQVLHQVWLHWYAGLCFLGAAYCAYFFRDPSRTIPTGDHLLLSPADGKILEVVETQDKGSAVWLVRIFLSVFDPHLQRVPLKGTVQKVIYKKGTFLDARDPQAHIDNEQNRVEIIGLVGATHVPVTVTQIAGLIARRILCWVHEGQSLIAGQQYGLIRFGSQVDITFPVSAQVRVKAGDRVKAGETVLANLL